MFKNLIIYRTSPLAFTLDQLEAALQKAPFIECGATQDKSAGWVSPRGEAHGALVESIGGQWIARLMTETKAVPATLWRARSRKRPSASSRKPAASPARRKPAI